MSLIGKHFDKFLLVALFCIVLICFICDPNKANAEFYKQMLAGFGGAILTLVTKSALSTPTTTTTTESPNAGNTTETKTEIKP